MNKQQLILLSGGIVLVAILFVFGNTIPPKDKTKAPIAQGEMKQPASALTTEILITESKKQLNAEQLTHITQVENSVVRGDVKAQQIKAYRQLGSFWMDSIHNHLLGAYYFGEAAKLENSEKNLTFAARLLLDELMAGAEPSVEQWLGNTAKVLFEKVLEVNPANDSAKVGLGACYIFGNISNQPMEGILKVREVAEKDSLNTYAQMVLGLGGIKSGQFDKAVQRFQTILRHQPGNLQAIFHLAETYDRMGDKPNAIKWYTIAAEKVEVPQAKKELKERIEALQLN